MYKNYRRTSFVLLLVVLLSSLDFSQGLKGLNEMCATAMGGPKSEEYICRRRCEGGTYHTRDGYCNGKLLCCTYLPGPFQNPVEFERCEDENGDEKSKDFICRKECPYDYMRAYSGYCDSRLKCCAPISVLLVTTPRMGKERPT